MKILAINCGVCGACLVEEDGGEGPFCPNCDLEDARKAVVENEQKYICPIDNVPMDKDLQGDIILDKCPKCGSYFLSNEELEEIIRGWYDRGFRDGGSRETRQLPEPKSDL